MGSMGRTVMERPGMVVKSMGTQPVPLVFWWLVAVEQTYCHGDGRAGREYIGAVEPS